MVFPLGSLVNALAIVGGSLAGIVLGTRVSAEKQTLVFQWLGLCVIVLGLQSALTATRPIITIAAIVGGGVIGECLRIEDRFADFGEWLKKRIKSSNPRFTQGLVNSTVIFCVGSLSILGSLEEGLRGTREIVYAKAIIDAFGALILAAGFGTGVLFSCIPVFIFQGLMVVGASELAWIFTGSVMAEISAAGGVIILGIGCNMLGVTKLKLGNLVPALVLAPLMVMLWS